MLYIFCDDLHQEARMWQFEIGSTARQPAPTGSPRPLFPRAAAPIHRQIEYIYSKTLSHPTAVSILLQSMRSLVDYDWNSRSIYIDNKVSR